MEIPVKVRCTYGIPGVGLHEEIYDRLDVNSVACWHANSALYPQLSAETIDVVTTDAIEGRTFLERLNDVNAEARELSKKMRKKIQD